MAEWVRALQESPPNRETVLVFHPDWGVNLGCFCEQTKWHSLWLDSDVSPTHWMRFSAPSDAEIAEAMAQTIPLTRKSRGDEK